jgi:oligoendopeptidase F
MKLILALLIAGPGGPMGAPALGAQVPEASSLSPSLYFASIQEEVDSRAKLHQDVPREVRALGASSPSSLVEEITHAERLIATLQTHAAFLKVRTLEDSTDQAAKAARNLVDADQSVLTAAIRARLLRVPPSETEALGTYAFLARTAREEADHALSPDAERYRSEVTSPTLQSLADAYDRIDAGLVRPKSLTSADTAARRGALAAWNEAHDRAAPEEAALLGSIVELENRDAAAEHYANAAERKYQRLGLSDTIVSSTLEAVRSEAAAYGHYQEVLARVAARRLGISPVLPAETGMATPPSPGVPLSQARQVISDALKPLGTEYVLRIARLLNPANGRLDLAGGAHRARQGTSINAYDAPTALYYSGYDGSLGDLSKLAHEGGHAIHRELMNASGSPIYQRSGPSYLFEGFAIFNELLLLDHAVKTAATPAQKEVALERLLSKIALELFVSAEEAAFERSLYLEAAGRGLLDRARIDALFQASLAPFESWPMADIGRSRGWMQKSLVFEDPLYLVNYLYASVIAVALFERSRTDPDFAPKYENLLRRGFDAPPQVLLDSMGIHLNDPSLVKPDARLLRENADALDQLCAGAESR